MFPFFLLLCLFYLPSLRGLEGMHFAFVPMTLAKAVTIGTVLNYLIADTRHITG
jgi:hypothetical protein